MREPRERLDADTDFAAAGPEPLLRAVVAAVVAESGDAFFRTLVQRLAEALGVEYAFVSEVCDDGAHFRSRALWAHGAPGAPFELPLAGGPCEAVLGGDVRHYADGLQARFPRCTALVDWGARSYAGVPIVGADGRIAGHFAVLGTSPMRDASAALDVMRVFAARVASELERQSAAEALRASEERLQRIVDSASDGIVSYGEDGLLVLFNRAAERILRCPAAEALGTSVARFGTEEGLRLVAGSLETLRRDPRALIFVGGDHAIPARRADGEVFLHEASLSRADVDGKPLYTVIFRDLEERRRVGRELVAVKRENELLREELAWMYDDEPMVGRSPAVRRVLEAVERVAPTDATVLIRGETGTGKELVARAIYRGSPRNQRPFVRVNCTTFAPGLVESELFGHEKGAFTGATERRIGRFERAQGGTIFLDEIGEIPEAVQVKLLRVLQEREIERVGGGTPIPVDVRVVAATNRDLEAAVADGSFREDLFYRLNVFPIAVPPLRERPGDVSLLARFFVERHAARIGRRITRIPPETLARLEAYAWPGNVRELENVVERAIILARGSELEVGPELLAAAAPALAPAGRAPARAPTPSGVTPSAGPVASLADAERQHIVAILRETAWRIEGETGAAARLGLRPSTLRSRMKKLGIARSG